MIVNVFIYKYTYKFNVLNIRAYVVSTLAGGARQEWSGSSLDQLCDHLPATRGSSGSSDVGYPPFHRFYAAVHFAWCAMPEAAGANSRMSYIYT